MSEPYVVFTVDGGIGKSIMATAVISSVKNHYPNHRIVVCSGYPEVFVNNPNVYRVFRSGSTPYFMEDYLKEDTVVMAADPYQNAGFFHKNEHLIKTWCKTCDVPCISVCPQLFLTQAELQTAMVQFRRDRPLFVIQTSGGPTESPLKYSWARDLPLNQAQAVVDAMNNTHHVMHIRHENQLAMNNCEPVSASFRELFALIALSDKRLLIDSFALHAAAAFELASVVCFVGTSPVVYSYDANTNLLPKSKGQFVHGIDKFLEDSPWIGDRMNECPYNTADVFDVSEIINTLSLQGQ